MFSSREIYNECKGRYSFSSYITNITSSHFHHYWFWDLVAPRWLWKDLLDQWDSLDALDPWYVICHLDHYLFISRVVVENCQFHSLVDSTQYKKVWPMKGFLFHNKSLFLLNLFFSKNRMISFSDDGDDYCVCFREIQEVMVWRERVETLVLR